MSTMTAQTTEVRFLSGNRGLRLLRKDAEDRVLPDNRIAKVKDEVVYEFKDGELTVKSGTDLLPDGPWDDATDAPAVQDALSWLRAHPDFGVRFHEVEPVAPDPAPLLAEITRAAAAQDVKKLKQLGDAEHKSWNRSEVLSLISDALDAIESKD